MGKRKFNKIVNNDKREQIHLPLIGKIRLGIKKVNEAKGTSYPAEVDYFVCPPEVQSFFGEKPKELKIMFPVNDPEECFSQFYGCYGGNQKLKCQGNGMTCERIIDDVGTKKEMECLGMLDKNGPCEYGAKNKCSARFALQFMIPEVSIGGVYQISSQSVGSDISVRSGIDHAIKVAGRLSGIPFILRREEAKMMHEGKMQTHYLLKLFPDVSIQNLPALQAGMTEVLIGMSGKEYLLPEPDVEGAKDDTPIVYTDEDAPVIHEAKVTPEPKAEDAIISEKARERLYVLMEEGGKTPEQVKEYLAVLGFESSTLITVSRYDEICKWIKTPLVVEG